MVLADRPRFHRTACALVAAAVALGLAGCVLPGDDVRGSGDPLMPKLSRNSYIEEGNLVALVVNVRTAAVRSTENFVGFEIAVVNKGLESLTVQREMLELVDAEGRRYPLAGETELYRKYPGIDRDRRLAELGDFIRGKYQTYSQIPSNITPTFDEGVVQDRILIPRNSYMLDYVYFPRPTNGVAGQRFELHLNSPELPDPVFVRFAVEGKKARS